MASFKYMREPGGEKKKINELGGYMEIRIIQLNIHERELTVVIHVFVDVILRRENLAHRSQKRLQHKINLLSVRVVEGDRLQASACL